jgi:hypothetical protein
MLKLLVRFHSGLTLDISTILGLFLRMHVADTSDVSGVHDTYSLSALKKGRVYHCSTLPQRLRLPPSLPLACFRKQGRIHLYKIPKSTHLNPEDGSNMYLQNVDNITTSTQCSSPRIELTTTIVLKC